MPAYVKRYQILLDGNSGSAALDACIDRLNRLETTVIRPYFLEVLRLYNENKLTLAQVTEIFLTTENYLFRRTMCDLPTNRSNFTGRIAPARSRKSPEIKPFHGHWSTFAGKAHGIKDRVLLDKTTPRLLQSHTLENAVKPPFLGGFFISSVSAAETGELSERKMLRFPTELCND